MSKLLVWVDVHHQSRHDLSGLSLCLGSEVNMVSECSRSWQHADGSHMSVVQSIHAWTVVPFSPTWTRPSKPIYKLSMPWESETSKMECPSKGLMIDGYPFSFIAALLTHPGALPCLHFWHFKYMILVSDFINLASQDSFWPRWHPCTTGYNFLLLSHDKMQYP
jgi:hypothetical protein